MNRLLDCSRHPRDQQFVLVVAASWIHLSSTVVGEHSLTSRAAPLRHVYGFDLGSDLLICGRTWEND